MAKPTKAAAATPRRRENAGGWMTASPISWVGAIASFIAIGSSIFQGVFMYASLEAKTARNTEEITRNFKEDEYHRERTIKAIERVDTNISSMTQIQIKIGVMETQMVTIGDILKRLEARLDRDSNSHGHKR